MIDINNSLGAAGIGLRPTNALGKLSEENTDNTHPTLVSYYVEFEHPAAPERWGDHGYRIFTD